MDKIDNTSSSSIRKLADELTRRSENGIIYVVVSLIPGHYSAISYNSAILNHMEILYDPTLLGPAVND